jgi:hypothetical protein
MGEEVEKENNILAFGNRFFPEHGNRKESISPIQLDFF